MKNRQEGGALVDAVATVMLVVVVLAVIVGIFLGGREFGWWLAADNVKRETKILDESVGRQDAIRSKIIRDLETVYDLDGYEQTDAIANQREAIVDGICMNAAKLNPDTNISPTVREFITMECPVPEFKESQVRQNLIDIITMQAEATATTSFFFLEGIGVVDSCSSIGFPIASTTQLTNPEQMNTAHQSPYTLPQIEPTGVYSPPDSSGTYVICVNGEGEAYANYWEGYVKTVSGPAEWDGEQVVLTGKPTGNISDGGS